MSAYLFLKKLSLLILISICISSIVIAEDNKILSQQDKYADKFYVLKKMPPYILDNGLLDSLGIIPSINWSKKIDEDVAYYENLSTDYMKSNKFKEAAEAIERIISLNPNKDRISLSYLILSNIYRNLRMSKEAENAVNMSSITIDYDDPVSNAMWSSFASSVSNYPSAIFFLRNLIRVMPDNAKAYSDLGGSYIMLSMYKEAIEAYKQAIRINPEDADAHYYLGTAFFILRKNEEAAEEFKQAIRINPDDAKAHAYLGSVYSSLKMYQEAVDAYKQAVKIKPDDAEAHYSLGTAYYFGLRMNEEAVKEFKEVIRINPENEQAHYYLGTVYFDLSKYKEAAEEFKQAIRIDPDDISAHGSLGSSYMLLRKPEEAKEEFRQVIRINPESISEAFPLSLIHYWRGKSYEALGDRGRALEEYKILKDLDKELANELFKFIYH